LIPQPIEGGTFICAILLLTNLSGWDIAVRERSEMRKAEGRSGLDLVDRRKLNINDYLKEAAIILGRKGGMAKTEAKANAARQNGKKGGRPKLKKTGRKRRPSVT
jgi:hypothetical protein